MKILVINPGLPHAWPQLQHMVEAGWDVHCLNIAPGLSPVGGVKYYDWWASGRRHTLGKLRYFAFGVRARKFARTLRPDVIHAHYASSAGLVACMSGYRPYAVTIHGSDLLDRANTAVGRFLLRRILTRAALVNPVAAHMVPVLHELGVKDEQIMVMPFGIDLSRLPYRPKQESGRKTVRLICCRAHTEPVYDIPTVLRALALLRDESTAFTLSLPAKGRLTESFKQLADELGISQRVEFGEGYKPQDVPDMFAASDLYVSSSRWDGASLSLMEAMACGIFPIVTDIPANREWLVPEVNGLVFAPGDYRQLAQCVRQAAGNPGMVRNALVSNRKIVEERADRSNNMKRLFDRLEQVAHS